MLQKNISASAVFGVYFDLSWRNAYVRCCDAESCRPRPPEQDSLFLENIKRYFAQNTVHYGIAMEQAGLIVCQGSVRA
jgi:hypothetical protein